MPTDVHLQTITEPRHLAVVRRRAKRNEFATVVPHACGVVWSAIKAAGVGGAGRHVAIYLDHEINLEVGVEMGAPFEGAGEVVGSSLPMGRVASAVHIGPYHTLGATHEAVSRWCKQHGHPLAGPCWEIYGHWEEAWNDDPSKIRTDVFYLLSA